MPKSFQLKKLKPHALLNVWGLFLGLAFYSVAYKAVAYEDGVDLDIPAISTRLIQANLPQDLAKDTLAWPLLPAETVEDLAALFYPNNIPMQALFVSQTLALNNQTFGAKDASPQVVIIIIPALKYLANMAPTKLKSAGQTKASVLKPWNNPLSMSYTLKDAAAYVVNPALVEAYAQLLARNAHLKTELEKLNAKLAGAQMLMTHLLTEAERFSDAAVAKTMRENDQFEPHDQQSQENQSKQNQDKQKLIKPLPQSRMANISKAPILQSPKVPDWPWLFWTPILPILLMIILAIVIVNRRKLAALRASGAGLFKPASTVTPNFSPLSEDAFNAQEDLANQEANGLQALDFSITKSEYQGDEARNAPFAYLEESEQLLEQAQMYVSFGRVDVATDLLRTQIKTMPKASLRHWLYLLDIYRETNQQAAFEDSARDLHMHYNVAIPAWQLSVDAQTKPSLEDYPHIMDMLAKVWIAEPEAAKAYLEALLTDTRQNERMGFSMSVFEEIVLLASTLTMREKMALNV